MASEKEKKRYQENLSVAVVTYILYEIYSIFHQIKKCNSVVRGCNFIMLLKVLNKVTVDIKQTSSHIDQVLRTCKRTSQRTKIKSRNNWAMPCLL